MHIWKFTFIKAIRFNKLWLVEKMYFEVYKTFYDRILSELCLKFAIYILINILINVQIPKNMSLR